MKTNHTFILVFTGILLLMSCSSDNEFTEPVASEEDQQEGSIPSDSLTNNDTPEIPDEEATTDPGADACEVVDNKGIPMTLTRYRNDSLVYKAQYYYGHNGQIDRISFYEYSESEIYEGSVKYIYEGEKLIKVENSGYLNGWVSTFYWRGGRIVKAEMKGGFYGAELVQQYKYDTAGRIIQKISLEQDSDNKTYIKYNYIYTGEGDLGSIDEYWKFSNSAEYKLIREIKYGGFCGNKNSFLEFQIIPWLSAQQRFPAYMEINQLSNNPDTYETYQYIYDDEGRVTEKIWANEKVIYQYY